MHIHARHAGYSADVQRIVAYAAEHACDEAINVKVAKAACSIRDNNISSRFRREVGQSIRDYIVTRRLDAAAALLATTETPITDIAYDVGYAHIQTFYRTFHRAFRCSPGEYRCSQRQTRACAEAV